MPKTIYVQFLSEQPNSNPHYLNRLIKLLNHFILIEPSKKTKGFESHHIVPKAKSWKPEWDKIPENHLRVPAKAHYVIHHLMWKAFPKDYAMIYTFHQMSNKTNKIITSKVYEISKIEFVDAQRKKALERVIDGSHHLLGPEMNKKRVANGTHNFLGGEIVRNANFKRVSDGTHPFLGGKVQRNRLENGTHPFQNMPRKVCPHCGTICSPSLYKRWHDTNCKRNHSK